jgi:hypothetical protein
LADRHARTHRADAHTDTRFFGARNTSGQGNARRGQ